MTMHTKFEHLGISGSEINCNVKVFGTARPPGFRQSISQIFSLKNPANNQISTVTKTSKFDKIWTDNRRSGVAAKNLPGSARKKESLELGNYLSRQRGIKTVAFCGKQLFASYKPIFPPPFLQMLKTPFGGLFTSTFAPSPPASEMVGGPLHI